MHDSSASRPRRLRRPPNPPAKYRRLVRCKSCFKQFDAGELAPGERFRCLCGAVLQVPRENAKGAQEAPVVRCASCGAPRGAQAVTCTFCAAPFALGEGSRNTLCPVCTSRIGDNQRFCHSCGTRIAPEAVVGERTDLCCPSCKPQRLLTSKRIPDAKAALAMLECGGCAGIWLGHPTFDSLQERAQHEATPVTIARPVRSAVHPGAPVAELTYRPCPVCRKLMIRRNFAAKSGIVVDVCSADGLWFDAEELDTVLAWIRSGGLERTAARLAEERKVAARREAFEKKNLQPLPHEETPQGHWVFLLGKLVNLVLGATGRRR